MDAISALQVITDHIAVLEKKYTHTVRDLEELANSWEQLTGCSTMDHRKHADQLREVIKKHL